MVMVDSGEVGPQTSDTRVHDAVAKLLLPFENRFTSPDVIRRYWTDFRVGDVDVLQGSQEVERLMTEPQEFAPLVRQLKSALLRNLAFTWFLASTFDDRAREPDAVWTGVDQQLDRGLNYLWLLDALTRHLESDPAVLDALLRGRIAEILFQEIAYQDFFEEAKCKGVFWGVHLFDAPPGNAVCQESVAWLLHANIMMAVVSEAVGRRGADAGDQNASSGYLLAERLSEHGLPAISSAWRASYQSWNAAFITNSFAQNKDAAKVTASALLLPTLFEAGDSGLWVHRRAISLLFVMLSTCHPESTLNLGTEVVDSAPVDAATLRAWGKANRDAAHEARLAGSHERAAGLNDMTRLTRQARAMNRFLSELRNYDSRVAGTREERVRGARELAGIWREIAVAAGNR